MRSLSRESTWHVLGVLAAMYAGTACSSKAVSVEPARVGGQPGTGGSATGGSAMGGASATGGTEIGGGDSGSGGVAGGGAPGSGGMATGGSTGYGGSTMESGTGGGNTGGSTVVADTGGSGAGGTGTGGSVIGTGGIGIGGSTAPRHSFTETVAGVSFEMVYVPGGTFTLGCESPSCPPDTAPVSGVKVSGYHIGKAEVTDALWTAVMGNRSGGTGTSARNITWYDAQAFTCELGQKTGRKYRMMTEAEFEYAAKTQLSSLEDVGSGEEWAYNSWSTTHMGGTDPVGPNPGKHVQKTRRDAQGTVDSITGRLIRSIDGVGPALRLTISAEMDYPPGYGPPCELQCPCAPPPGNSYRDP